MLFLKLFNPLKWALSQSLIKLSESQSAGFSVVAKEINETRITLLHVCGIDPTKVQIDEVHRLSIHILELQELKARYEREIKTLESKYNELKES